MSSTDTIKRLCESNESTTKLFRWGSWLMSIVGHYFLFSPIIKLLSWIPLVGWLLAGIIKFAAIIFSVVWASMVHLLILGVSWLFFRPILGALFLTGVTVLIFIMNMGTTMDPKKVGADGQSSQSVQ
mmetsp:Transcript_4184/g.7097  ORF Transcript_4184/g.7097 Transcript_4184/m.7097 type:complete len:127 (-) Transcript_4184:132-512(-)